ncbi:mitochondrial carrier [Exidia glandulosa HHB12029]|uniref:Mitochondrial carrier n=1 Tax=Exidia glandulosa HHB12029 TaxID=1314781 RepID=A0A165HP80_EXIGL|nr:mitochondrial carrier [Exidia glandulosa HHB12029]
MSSSDPASTTRFPHWRLLKSRPDRDSYDYLARSTLAGGFAGGLAKTCIAPLERVKILFQTHNKEYAKYSGAGLVYTLRDIAKKDGIRGLFRGHSLTLARAIPHAAVGFTIYEAISAVFMPTRDTQTSSRRLVTGAVTGLSTLPFTYPFELIRVRMAIDTRTSSQTQRVNPWTAMRAIWNEGIVPGRQPSSFLIAFPFFHFYRGFAVSALGTIPYRGGIFLVWETLNAAVRSRLDAQSFDAHRGRIHLVVGAVAGASAQIVTYPLEVIRRVQQASGTLSPTRTIRFGETIVSVWQTRGWRGFYSGLGIGLVKQVPMHSISLASWQAAKVALNID